MTAKKSPKDQKKGSKDIGLGIKPPKDSCQGDKNCPFHGEKNVRGRIFHGTVIRAKVPRAALVEWGWKKEVPKYERYEKRRTRVTAHNPACINAQVGDMVKLIETRKISKTKNFVIVEKNASS